MALEEYRRKRDFRQTPEPSGGQTADGAAPVFVVQKHAARRLHWDFRLEIDGVLKSWAVTKEPGREPGQRRLAVATEDHPMDYGGFEGVIPKGQYGGGTVMLWDRGRWEPLGDPAAGLAKGKLSFRLHGHRLAGTYHLVRMEGRNWLLITGSDRADPVDDLTPDVSVESGRSMGEIAQAPERVWNGEPSALDPAAVTGARKVPMPKSQAPMLATLADEAPSGGQWLHEIKFDGYRLLARIEDGACRLFTRNGHDWTAKFPTIAAACAALPCRHAWIDGEVVALDKSGVSRFHDLQAVLSRGGDGGLVYHVFDLTYADGFDLSRAALVDRKQALRRLMPDGAGVLRYTDHLADRGPDFRRQACAFALEGVVSKRADRPYKPGRSKDWLKAKCVCRQEFVIVGFTRPSGKRAGIGALVLGVYGPDGALAPAGRVGTGFGAAEAEMLERRMVAVESPPFASAEKGVTWVAPDLVAEVEFAEWTPDGALRHPSYQGLRLDKDPRQVVREDGGSHEGLAEDRLDQFRLTSPDKVLFPEQGLTKRALAAYYLEVAGWILPHLRGRPLTLVRCPQGREGKCFYQRHPKAGMAKSIRRFTDGDEDLLMVEDVAGLVGLVQMGALEIHTWGATTAAIERPDMVVFDLDPDEGLAWGQVVEAAREIHDRLKALGLAAFVKTTGGKGLHVVVPLEPHAEWPAVKAFCKAFAENLASDRPARYTANMAKARRKGRIFVDYLRNQRSATFVAPYSCRARIGAPVAVPLAWGELESGIRADHFTVESLPRRLKSLSSDPWAGFRAAARPLPQEA